MDIYEIPPKLIEKAALIGIKRKNYHRSYGGGQGTTIEQEQYGALAELLIDHRLYYMGIDHMPIIDFSLEKNEYSKEDLVLFGKTIEIKCIPKDTKTTKRRLAMVNINTFKNSDYYVFIKIISKTEYIIAGVETGENIKKWNIFDLYTGQEAYSLPYNNLTLTLEDILNE